MKLRAIGFLTLAFAFTTLCVSASADSVVIGTNTSANVYPFGDSGYSGEYQQDYNGALFSGPVEITSITFFTAAGYTNQVINGSYTLALSTTSASTVTGPGGLSTVYASNIGSDNEQFFSGAVSNTLTFNGTPFLYDPSKGNLLLDVEVLSGNGLESVLAAGCSTGTNRVFNYGGNGAPTSGSGSNSGPLNCGSAGYGLETQINYTPAVTTSVTPEPSSFLFLGSGMLSLAGVVRRRLRRA